jgi:hypothetical protein
MDRAPGGVMLDHVVRITRTDQMATMISTPAAAATAFPVEMRRIVPCAQCGGRRRTLIDTAHGLRAHCMGCGEEVAFPFATETAPLCIGRAGQVVVHG